MRRADRLFRIIQALRGARRPLTAASLAQRFEVSRRTVYRDVEELQAQNVPILGEAGIGYVLKAGYDMPPLMFTQEELDALALGAQWVAARAEPALADAARDAVAKLGDVLPGRLRPVLVTAAVMGPDPRVESTFSISIPAVRQQIHRHQKIMATYLSLDGTVTQRVLWPLAVAYFETVQVLVAWCERRNGFRHFRIDRMTGIQFLEEAVPRPREQLMGEWDRLDLRSSPS